MKNRESPDKDNKKQKLLHMDSPIPLQIDSLALSSITGIDC